jgi:hypothetical protein
MIRIIRTKRGAHSSRTALIKDIESFIDNHANPKPLHWTKSADDILVSIDASADAPSIQGPKGA